MVVVVVASFKMRSGIGYQADFADQLVHDYQRL